MAYPSREKGLAPYRVRPDRSPGEIRNPQRSYPAVIAFEVMEETALALSAVAALGALGTALAAWKSARATERSTELTERAALLNAIPVLVPWIDSRSATLHVKNRGHADAHELKWHIEAGGEDILSDEMPDVIPADGSKRLTGTQNAIVSALSTKPEAVVVCEYLTSWGELLRAERSYRNGKSAGLRLLDADGEALTIRGRGKS